MSRTMQSPGKDAGRPTGGTPIWVWVIYALGIFAATIVVFSILFTAGAYLLSDDVPVSVNVSAGAVVLWLGLVVLAGGIWLARRRRR
jgi:LPXTG-motif cell wall-anchored protein